MSDETLLRLLGRISENVDAAKDAIQRGRRDLAEGNLTCAHSLIDWIELRRNTPDRPVPTCEPAQPQQSALVTNDASPTT